MKEVALTNRPDRCALVDDEDYPRISEFNWQYHPLGYAVRGEWKDKKVHIVYMHHEVKGRRAGTRVTFVNGNRLDNRRENLQVKRNASKYAGVTRSRNEKSWQARPYRGGKRHYLGTFDSEELARDACEDFYNGDSKNVVQQDAD